MSAEFSPIFVAATEPEALQMQAFLEAWGIPSTLRRRTAARRLFGITLRGSERIEVLVNAPDAAKARDLLARADAGEFRLDDDHEEP